MPIYEYRCQTCQSHFEKMQKVSDAPLTVCENCGGALEKQWSLSGFQFKGAGWYVTDYSNKGKTDAKTETPSGGKSETAAADSSSSSSEKSSAGESTATPQSASNTAKGDTSTSNKE